MGREVTKGLETLAAMEEVETTRDGIFVSIHPETLNPTA